ncbi:LysM peptidoglycan-binding domain-containing protein [Bacillus sp. EB600]|nr:LysM peptidoglycan-binding domain-containing protein [Bacillus sp. EB600]
MQTIEKEVLYEKASNDSSGNRTIIYGFWGVCNASADVNTYTVHSGDSLWKISQTYRVTVVQLKDWNHLSSDTIYLNQYH